MPTPGARQTIPRRQGVGHPRGRRPGRARRVEQFLKQHLGEAPVAKVRSGEPLNASDIAHLQRIHVAAGIGDEDSFAEASAKAGSFGLFIRSIVGLDRTAAKAPFTDFLDDKRYSKNQIHFVN